MNDHSAGYVELPRTAYLDHTLRRARTAAGQRSHRYVTLEHFLLALLDDPDALMLLQTAGADIAGIQSTIADAVNNRMASLVVPDGQPPSFSYKFDTLFLAASDDAIRAGRRDIDGGIALIAVAKDTESNASAILAAGGFYVQTALHALTGTVQPQPAATHAQAPATYAAQAEMQANHRDPEALGTAPSDSLMEEMLASVRNILDAEERKERGLPPPVSPAPFPPAPPPAAQPRFEPHLRAEQGADSGTQRGAMGLRAQAPYQGQERAGPAYRAEPSPGHVSSSPAYRQPGADYATGFAEPSAQGYRPDAARAVPPQEPEKRLKPRDPRAGPGRGETPGLVAKLLEHVPRKTRMGVPETIQIRLSKEEAGIIFGQSSRRGQAREASEAPAACRAVTIRLAAPEGGFFIETWAPETQWVLDRPSFLGDEVFGMWAWTVIPNERGPSVLTVSISARDVDENGLAGDLKVPEQGIEVRVRGNFWRGFWGFVRAILLLAAGSGLMVGIDFALKMMGKLSH